MDAVRQRWSASERVHRAVRAGVWFLGSLLGGALFLWLLLGTWDRDTIPGWAGLLAVIATLLCGDVAERAVLSPRAPAAG